MGSDGCHGYPMIACGSTILLGTIYQVNLFLIRLNMAKCRAVNWPVVDTIYPQCNKFAMGLTSKATFVYK